MNTFPLQTPSLITYRGYTVYRLIKIMNMEIQWHKWICVLNPNLVQLFVCLGNRQELATPLITEAKTTLLVNTALLQEYSAQISSGGAHIKEYIYQKFVKQSYFSINETCCNTHYE